VTTLSGEREDGSRPGRGSDDPNRAFDEIVEAYYRAWFRYHPEAAVEAGVMGYAGLLTPYGDDDIGALLSLHQALLGSIDEFNVSGLDADRRMDCRLLYGAAVLEMEALLNTDWRKRDPSRFIPVNAIYQLTVRPVENFAASLRSRLQAIPEYLRGARQLIGECPENIPGLWLEAAVEEARSGVEYLRSLPDHPKVTRLAKRLSGMEGLLNDAIESLLAYADMLEQDLAAKCSGTFACGRQRFDRLLHHRHALDVDADQLYSFGRTLFEQTERGLKDVCLELSGSEDIAALTDRIQSDHPAPKDLLASYRQQMQAARDFVTQNNLLTMPKLEHLDVVETPVFLRHQIPFAAYMEPSPNDAGQQGYYYVTPANNDDDLREHNYAGLMHTCVHEAWPGHHLQFVTANSNPVSRSLPRLLNPSATLYEGWALYSEQLMQEQGFLNKPEQRFVLLKDRLWRSMRVMIDVEIQTRDVSLDDAAGRMVKWLGFTRSQAMADLTWYSQAPTVPMGYATGWALINASRDRLRAEEQDRFHLKGFHDQLLSAGSMALPLVIERIFGRDLWQRVRGMVFGRE